MRSTRESGKAAVVKLGQKVRFDRNVSSALAHTTMYLDEGEAALLSALPAAVLTKTRHLLSLSGDLEVAVDVFHGRLRGLIMAEIDLGASGTLAEPVPSWLGVEVTDVEEFTGHALAGMDAEVVARLLATFGLYDTRIMRLRGGRPVAAVAVGFALCGLAGCSVGTPAARTTVPAAAASGYPADVTAALCGVGLRPAFVTAPPIWHADRSVNGYAVTSISPAPLDRVAPGSAVQVRLAVSVNAGGPWPEPPATSVVPSVIGMDVNTALATLTADGVLVDVTTVSPTGAMVVATQAPAAGETVQRGSTVTLTVGTLNSDGCPTS